MKIEYDAAHDLLNIEFLANVPIDDSVEIDDVVIDYAKDKRIVAIEVLDASKRTTRKPVDLIDLAIVKSSGAGPCGKKGRAMAAKRKPKQNVFGHRPAEGRVSESLNHFDGVNRVKVWNLLNDWNDWNVWNDWNDWKDRKSVV